MMYTDIMHNLNTRRLSFPVSSVKLWNIVAQVFYHVIEYKIVCINIKISLMLLVCQLKYVKSLLRF
jgi:hypothetical protein